MVKVLEGVFLSKVFKRSSEKAEISLRLPDLFNLNFFLFVVKTKTDPKSVYIEYKQEKIECPFVLFYLPFKTLEKLNYLPTF